MKPIKIATVILLSLLASTATADVMTTYNINFVPSGNGPPPSGSFTYDSTNPHFTNFKVLWDNITFDLTANANAPNDVGTPPGCTGEGSAAFGFAMMSQNAICPQAASYQWVADTNSFMSFFEFELQQPTGGVQDVFQSFLVPGTTFGGFDNGTWTITPIPEPRLVILIAAALALVKRTRRV
jgi:hypothetical protein